MEEIFSPENSRFLQLVHFLLKKIEINFYNLNFFATINLSN